jgi:16S rRNA (cytosine967-C5)-methyltransferase
MDLFRNGMFTIQDEAQRSPPFLIPAGNRVIISCGARGKTTNVRDDEERRGDRRTRQIRGKLHRSGPPANAWVRIVDLHAVDAALFEAPPADRVLLDAPCSGLGTLAKKPDMKWKRDLSDIRKLTGTQEALMESAARLLKPGGALVYSTCTTEPEENSEIITAFLSRHPEFSLDRRIVFACGYGDRGRLRGNLSARSLHGWFVCRAACQGGRVGELTIYEPET